MLRSICSCVYITDIVCTQKQITDRLAFLFSLPFNEVTNTKPPWKLLGDLLGQVTDQLKMDYCGLYPNISTSKMSHNIVH